MHKRRLAPLVLLATLGATVNTLLNAPCPNVCGAEAAVRDSCEAEEHRAHCEVRSCHRCAPRERAVVPPGTISHVGLCGPGRNGSGFVTLFGADGHAYPFTHVLHDVSFKLLACINRNASLIAAAFENICELPISRCTLTPTGHCNCNGAQLCNEHYYPDLFRLIYSCYTPPRLYKPTTIVYI